MKPLIFIYVLALSGCHSGKFAVIDEIKGAGCELSRLMVMEDKTLIECHGFNPAMYFIELPEDKKPSQSDVELLEPELEI